MKWRNWKYRKKEEPLQIKNALQILSIDQNESPVGKRTTRSWNGDDRPVDEDVFDHQLYLKTAVNNKFTLWKI